MIQRELDSKALEAAAKQASGLSDAVWESLSRDQPAYVASYRDGARAAITAYLSALPAPATQEVDELREIKPVAWRWRWGKMGDIAWHLSLDRPPSVEGYQVEPLYLSPPPIPAEALAAAEALPPAFITSTSDKPNYYVTIKTETLRQAQRWHDAVLALAMRTKP